MKLRCERDTLLEALATTSRAAATRAGAVPALSGIRFEVKGHTLRLTATDLDLTIQGVLNVDGVADGVAVVPARLVTDIVRALPPGAVTMAFEEGEASIAAGRSQFSVRTLPAEEFLRLAEPAAEGVTVDAAALSGALHQVVRAASRDDSRPILTGVLLSAEATGLRLVATDSYRLALRDLPGTSFLAEGQHVLVPARALGELGRLLSTVSQVTVGLSATEATFDTGATRLTTRLIEGEFPSYEKLIPSDYPHRLTVAKEPFVEAVRRVKLLAREATPVRLSLGADLVELTAVTQDVGQAREEVDAKYEGNDMVVAFNPEYLVEGVEAVAGDEVRLETLDALKPATLRPVDTSDFLYLLMPVRVS